MRASRSSFFSKKVFLLAFLAACSSFSEALEATAVLLVSNFL